MKKLILLILFLFFSCSVVLADIVPTTTTSIPHYGFGVLNMKDSFCVYSEPNEYSKVLKKVDFEQEVQYQPILDRHSSLEGTVIVYVPASSIALVAVESNQENGWYEVYYDQKNGKTGWVKQTNPDAFKTWKNAFNLWGKKYGLYIFRDVPDEKKRLYSQDNDVSQALESFTYPKNINFSMIRGNWMLATVLDVGDSTKIGWIRWRDDNGNLLIFPYFE